MTATPIPLEAHAYLVKRQIDEDRKEGKIGYLSNKDGQMIRGKQTQQTQWDVDVNVCLVAPVLALCIPFSMS